MLFGRDATGNRSGLIPPRRCQRVANRGAFCGVHAKQAELQGLLQDCLAPGWERKVERWEKAKRDARVQGATKVVGALRECALREHRFSLAAFLSMRKTELAEILADQV